MCGHFRYELWYTDSDPGICDDLGKPLPDGWYCNLFAPNIRYPGVFGPFLTADRAIAEAEAKIERAELSSRESHQEREA